MKKQVSLILGVILMTAQVNILAAGDTFPKHEPYGESVGAMPGRVVWAHEPDSVEWDGIGYWWETNHFDESVIQNMVDSSIAKLGGKKMAAEGWNALFADRNERNGESGGYQKGEKIAIKANINGSAVMDNDTSGRTQMSYTNPVLLKALLVSLVTEAGAAPADITVYDVSRLFPDYMVQMCSEGILQGVHFVGRDNGRADESAPIVWSHKFSGKVNYLPTCVTEAKYMINLANLKGHSYGITLCGKNHFGSFINGNAMRPPEGANLHQWLTKNEMGIYSPLADLMANKHLGGKTVLYMLDAIICATSEGASITGSNSKWQQAPFHNDYTASIFVSQDPVAIDSVGADFLTNEPTIVGHNSAANDPTVENYLHEAGLAAKSPSGTVYTDSFGKTITTLGVHEHWNNPVDKQYSRNLGKNEGIELVMADSLEDRPELHTENGKIIVNNAAPNGMLLLTFYNSSVLVNVKTFQGDETIEVDVDKLVKDNAIDATNVKAFFWDLKSIKPLCNLLSLPLDNMDILPEEPITPERKNTITLTIHGQKFTVLLEENETAERFQKLLPMTIQMSELNGNEKYYYLPEQLPANAQNVGTIHAGDIMLFGANCVVLFYETFQTSYQYTKIGHIEDSSALKTAVGSGSVTVTIE